MDFGFFGIIDLIVLGLGILAIFIGYKIGFMKKFIGLFGALIIILLSFLLAPTFAQILIKMKIIYPSIYNGVYSSVADKVASSAPDASVEDIIKSSLGALAIFSSLIIKHVNVETKEELPDCVASKAAGYAMNVIAFFILIVIFIILLIILKIIVSCARDSAVVRRVDGILGIFLYFGIYLVIISLLFFLLKIFIDHNVFTGNTYEFFVKDLQLNTDSFRLSKFIYNGNLFLWIKELF